MRTNAPRMVTVMAALGLLVLGLALTVFAVKPALDAVHDALAENELDYTTDQVGWTALLASNLLLVAGSLFKGV